MFALREVVTNLNTVVLGKTEIAPAGSQAVLRSHCEKSLHNLNTIVLGKTEIATAGSQAVPYAGLA